MVCGHGENDFVSESMNKSKQKSGEDDVRRLPLKRHSERGKNALWEKRESGTVTQSEESMTLMTFYGFPHHGNRSFAVASG